MTDRFAVLTIVIDALKANADLVAVIPAGPGEYGPGIYRDASPDGAELPALVVQVVPGGEPINPQNRGKQMATLLVMAFVLDSFKRTENPVDDHPAAALIESTLSGLTGTIDGKRISLEPLEDIYEVNDDPPTRYRQTGIRLRARISHSLN